MCKYCAVWISGGTARTYAADMEVLGEASEKRSVLEAEQRKLEHSDSKNVSTAS